jgi:hypothetical protein
MNDSRFNVSGFSYDPLTGEISKDGRRRDYQDTPYRRVCERGVRVTAHRLGWRLMTGEWPPGGLQIDHKDGDRTNNKASNLRLSTQSQNQYNRATTAPERCVHFCKTHKRWHVGVKGAVNVYGYASHSISAFVAARLIRRIVQGEFTTDRKAA